MKKYFIILLLLLISCNGFSQESITQVLDKYPIGSQFYQGGRMQFYKEFHQLLLEKKITQCSNKNEYFNLKLVVYPDSSVKLIKQDSVLVAKAKCTYNTSKEVLKYMKGWIPAEINGEKHPAMVSLLIYMDDLFDKYTDSYVPDNYTTIAKFEGGIGEFRKRVANSIDLSKFRTNSSITFKVIVNFEIDEEGKMQNIKLLEETNNKDFNEMILQSIRSIRKKWVPATFHDFPIKSYFKMPLNFNFE